MPALLKFFWTYEDLQRATGRSAWAIRQLASRDYLKRNRFNVEELAVFLAHYGTDALRKRILDAVLTLPDDAKERARVRREAKQASNGARRKPRKQSGK